MRNKLRVLTTGLMIAVMMISMAGCAKNSDPVAKAGIEDLMKGVSAKAAETGKDPSVYGAEVADFAMRLFNTCRQNDADKGNTLISPLSVLLALSMTANGAEGETLEQMETVLGLSKDDLNEFAGSYMKLLSDRDKSFGKLNAANSIWFTDDERFTVEQSFLQTNADHYGADIYKAPFDGSTLKAINNWVNEKTDGMIPKILDNIPDSALMYLVNALAFDAKWAEPYKEHQVYDDIFTTAAGKEEKIPYLHGGEKSYISDENAQGFIKYYKGYQYAFAALLPNEGVDPDSYLDSLDGAHLRDMLVNRESCTVYTSMPKFEIDYSTEMSEQLKSMGMEYAFDGGKADFSKLGTSTGGNIFISRVIHKTYIAVDEDGTRAGAATAVEMNDGGSFIQEEPKKVYLTRPFIYMLIDCETNTPFFIGIMRDPED